jgi:hypothetical protein
MRVTKIRNLCFGQKGYEYESIVHFCFGGKVV